MTMESSTLDETRAAKAHAAAAFAGLAEVVGSGITRAGAGYALKVNLRAAPAAGVELPAEIDGVPVRVEIVGMPAKR